MFPVEDSGSNVGLKTDMPTRSTRTLCRLTLSPTYLTSLINPREAEMSRAKPTSGVR